MIKTNDLFKKILLYGFPIIAIILCLFATETSQAAKKALYLCIDVVIPSLFPFFVLSGIIMPYISTISCPNLFKRLIGKLLKLPYYTIVIIILGFLSGYPNGAKMANDMFNEGLIDSRQATKLLTATNYCSPLFVVGTVGAGLFKSIKLGLFLLLIHWISGVLAAYITAKITNHDKTNTTRLQSVKSTRSGAKGNGPKQYRTPNIVRSAMTSKVSTTTKGTTAVKADKKPLSILLTSSIESAAILCVKLTGYIVFFAVVSELLSRLGVFSFIGKGLGLFFQSGSENYSELITATLRGFMEITSGAQAINQVKGIQLNIQLAAISLIFGFAGFSVHSQIIGIMSGSGAKYKIFFFAKLIHGVLGCLLTLVTIYLMPMTVQTATIIGLSTITWSWGRPIIVIVLLLSLLIPSCIVPIKNRGKNIA